MARRTRATPLLLVLLALLVSGCGSSSGDAPESRGEAAAETTAPVAQQTGAADSQAPRKSQPRDPSSEGRVQPRQTSKEKQRSAPQGQDEATSKPDEHRHQAPRPSGAQEKAAVRAASGGSSPTASDPPATAETQAGLIAEQPDEGSSEEVPVPASPSPAGQVEAAEDAQRTEP